MNSLVTKLYQTLVGWRYWRDCLSWKRILLVVATAIELGTIWRLMGGYDRPPMTPDAGIFQHIGWYLTQGGRLYVDAWEPKLPLSFETTAILSLLAGDDMYLFHIFNVALMMAAAVGIVLLVGALTYHLTGDSLASIERVSDDLQEKVDQFEEREDALRERFQEAMG